MALIKGKKAMWLKLATPEKKYASEETQWSLILVVDDETSRKWVRSGLSTKERFMDIDGKEQPILKLKKDTHWKKSGEEKTPVKVVDMYGQDIDPRTIGNGSTVNVQYSVRDWEYGGRKGKSTELVAVQVSDLVEYTGGANKKAGDEFEFMARDKVSLDDGNDFDDNLDLELEDEFE